MFQEKEEAVGGHAWNIVTINGQNYPVDLTWDSAKFRSGKSETFNFLGQDVKEFKQLHIPDDDDPCKNYVLSEIDSKLIRRINLRFSREKDYKSRTYYGRRKDGTRYMIAQVGDNEIDNKTCHRYYYADLTKEGSASNPSILYSETNVARFINAVQWNKSIPLGYEEAIVNVLFSNENIKDSLKRGTGYIGKVIKDEKDEQKGIQFVKTPSEISKSYDKQKQFQYPTKVFKRYDGSTFVAQKMNNGRNVDGIKVMTYHIFEAISENGRYVVKRNVVFSERDFLQDDRPGIANDYLSRERLDRKNKETAGYLGYYDENGIRTYNSNLVKFFKNTHKINPNSPKKENTLKEAKLRQLTPKKLKIKTKWIKSFIDDYKASSLNNDGLRFNEENENILKVLEGMRASSFDISKDLTLTKNGQYVQEYKVMGKLARLLIEADNLTIDGGENYLEIFSNIPEIDKLLLQLRNSQSVKEMREKAYEARTSGEYPKNYRETRAEIDKRLAQEYLRSDNLSKNSVTDEIYYRIGLAQNDKVKISNEKNKDKISRVRKQQISLTRVLARQLGKIPSKEKYDKKIGWYFETDKQSRVQPSDLTVKSIASPLRENISLFPDEIINSTLKVALTKNEISEVLSEIRQSKTKDVQEIQSI